MGFMGKPKSDLAATSGLGLRCSEAFWRMPPPNDEDFLRAFMSDSPLREQLEEFFYIRRCGRVEEALNEESRRDPYGAAAMQRAQTERGTKTISAQATQATLRPPQAPVA